LKRPVNAEGVNRRRGDGKEVYEAEKEDGVSRGG